MTLFQMVRKREELKNYLKIKVTSPGHNNLKIRFFEQLREIDFLIDSEVEGKSIPPDFSKLDEVEFNQKVKYLI